MLEPSEWSTYTQEVDDVVEAVELTLIINELQQKIKVASDKRRYHLRKALGSHSRQFVAQRLHISEQRLGQLVGKRLPGERFDENTRRT